MCARPARLHRPSRLRTFGSSQAGFFANQVTAADPARTPLTRHVDVANGVPPHQVRPAPIAVARFGLLRLSPFDSRHLLYRVWRCTLEVTRCDVLTPPFRGSSPDRGERKNDTGAPGDAPRPTPVCHALRDSPAEPPPPFLPPGRRGNPTKWPHRGRPSLSQTVRALPRGCSTPNRG